jgi:sugar (pentulose or hexulose) kinase
VSANIRATAEAASLSHQQAGTAASDALRRGETSLGIELGSSTIKACLIGPDFDIIATSSHAWENQFVDGSWTYSLESVWAGIQSCTATLLAAIEDVHGVRPHRFGAIGVSAMMHGYLAFDAAGELLVPFRTWRNTNTVAAAAELSRELDFNIPLRWSAAHLYQAVLDDEPHVPRIARITTLAGYVHWKLTGSWVLGVGDASGVFPVDPATTTYDDDRLTRFERLVSRRQPELDVRKVLPEVLPAGAQAGRLTDAGCALLDPTDTLQPGVPFAPPEGDAGTGMIATNSIAPHTGNVSAGTSIFAMVVLDQNLRRVHEEVDIVATPVGQPVAMVHCNNGASEFDAWVRVFADFATAAGTPLDDAAAFAACLDAALDGEPDGGGLLAYNYLAGEPVTGLPEGRPLVARTPASRLTLANFMRTQVYSVFGTLSLGLRTLAEEGVRVESMLAHGGMFRTAGVAQRFLAAALDTPVTVRPTAGQGGAWGCAILADYVRTGARTSLHDHLQHGFSGEAIDTVVPDAADRAGFEHFLARYEAGLAVERAAVNALS